MNPLKRSNVRVSGKAGGQPIVFAHGFGCDQNMGRFVAPEVEATHQVVLSDHVGAGGSKTRAYGAKRHSTLEGYAEDVNDICEKLRLRDAVLVGHSVSAMIGMLAVIDARPEPSRSW